MLLITLLNFSTLGKLLYAITLVFKGKVFSLLSSKYISLRLLEGNRGNPVKLFELNACTIITVFSVR